MVDLDTLNAVRSECGVHSGIPCNPRNAGKNIHRHFFDTWKRNEFDKVLSMIAPARGA